MTRAWRFAGSGVVAVTLACGGGEESPRPSGAPLKGATPPAASTGLNHPPVIERVRFEPDEPIPGGHVRALVQASDPDGGSVRLRYAWTLGGAPLGTDAPEVSLERGHKAEDLAVTVTASDGSAESAPVRASTSLGNRGPQLLGVALEPAEGLQVGGTVKAVPEAQDPDDDPLRYEITWRVNGSSVQESGRELETQGLRRGDRIVAEVRATDGTVTTQSVTSRELQIGNSAPQIVSRPETRFEEGVFRYDVQAKDPDGERNLHFSLRGAPEGMTIDRLGGEIRWMPKPEQSGKHSIEVVVQDSQGAEAFQTFEVTIAKESAAPAPQETPAAPAAE